MSGKWDEVDPRVEWAMKVMDTEGMVFESEVEWVTVIKAPRWASHRGVRVSLHKSMGEPSVLQGCAFMALS
jgi:hypothetical protein